MNPLLDYKFLYDLDRHKNRVTYVRITSLTLDQLPVEQIEGVATGGSITIDGSSSVRRICNLTMSTKNLNINQVYWGITTRIKLELGLKNDLINYKQYNDIIWFPMGTYILNEFKTSSQVNNYTISLSGKDKMCLLNGDISGEFNAETDLGTEEVWDDKIRGFVKEKRPIDYIIREMVHHYAQEDFANIIIKDIKHSLEILTNRTGHNIFVIRKTSNGEIEEVIPDLVGQSEYQFMDNSSVDFLTLAEKEGFNFQTMVDEDDIALVTVEYTPTIIKKGKNYYTVSLIAPGEDLGYRVMSTEFPEDLIAAVGDTVTSILDKIIKYFTNYEYFYNANGQFVFQEKQTYVNTAWNGIIRQDKENYVDPSSVRSKVQYSFEGSALVSANQNTPNIGKIKNDYTVWGKKKTPSGKEYPIHMRYAIDLKPKAYRTYSGSIYCTEEYYKNIEDLDNIIVVDWREVIYQMALDYYAHNHDDDYSIQLRQNNKLSNEINLYPTGRTGYEQYYHDIQGFWRLLYIPEEEREKYFSPDRILAGWANASVEGFVWTDDENGYIFDKENAKTGEINYSNYKEYYIDNDEDGTLRSVDDKSQLIDSQGVVYTLKLLVQRDKIIEKIQNDELALIEQKVEELQEELRIKRLQLSNLKNQKKEKEKALEDLRILIDAVKKYYSNPTEENRNEINAIYKGSVYYSYWVNEEEYITISIVGVNDFRDIKNEEDILINEIASLESSIITLNDYLFKETPLDEEGTLSLTGQIKDQETKRSSVQKKIQIATAALAPYNFVYFCDKNEEDFYKNITYTLHGFPQFEIDTEFKETYKGYNKNIFIDPSALIFWFDFFDADSLGVGQFSVPAIGDRPKTMNNDGIRALIYQDVPDIIFINQEDIDSVAQENSILDGYTIIELITPEQTLEEYRQSLLEKEDLTEQERLEIQERIDIDTSETEDEGLERQGFWRWYIESGKIDRSSRSTTAQEEIDNMLYTMAYCNENITITSVPIYYLIPNTIISADDEQRNIGGYYILDKMTIPLNYNGTMQSTAIKVPERIY